MGRFDRKTRGRRGRQIDHQPKCFAEKREQLEELLARHGWLIGKGCAREAEIRLETGDAYPISRPPYRLDP